MIQKVDDSFPVPVSGKLIQQGWFGALVRFVNSLRLRGDGRYFMVSRNPGGTTIQPSPALLQAIDHSGGTAPAAGGGGGSSSQFYPWFGHGQTVPVTKGSTIDGTPIPSPPTAAMVYKPSSDGFFYADFWMGRPLQYASAFFELDVYSHNPVSGSVSPTDDFHLAHAEYQGTASCGVWLPAPAQYWYVFTVNAYNNADLYYLDGRVFFYPIMQ